jgi:leader peptidase (prepilin peptidase) / N-methyltransferase
MSIRKSLPGLSPACARRRRSLAPLAVDILLARGDAKALTPAAWLAVAGLFALLGQTTELGLLLAPSLCLFACLCLISLFDARYFVIPDGPLVALCACAPLVWLGLEPEEALWRLPAAAMGYAALRFVAVVYEWRRGHAGVGEGDARLYAVAGLWLGFPGLPGCLIYAALSALLSAAVARRQGSLTDLHAPLPFGPHLALGLWLTYVLGPLEFG